MRELESKLAEITSSIRAQPFKPIFSRAASHSQGPQVIQDYSVKHLTQGSFDSISLQASKMQSGLRKSQSMAEAIAGQEDSSRQDQVPAQMSSELQPQPVCDSAESRTADRSELS